MLPPFVRLLRSQAALVLLMAVLLIVPSAGSEQRFGGQVPGRGTVQTPPQTQGAAKNPPQGQVNPPGQRPQPNAEQYLGRFDWWKDESIKKELKLTDMQARRITGIFDGRVREVTPFFDEFQKQMTELDRLTKERTVDLATYTMQVNRAEALRSKLNETRTVMLYRIYRELDPAQYQKLREILDRRRAGPGRGGASIPGRGGAPIPKSW